MKDCENCINLEKGHYNGECDACLNNPDAYHSRWTNKDWREIYQRIELLGGTINSLAGACIARNMIRSYAEEILLRCDELEGKDTNIVEPLPSPPRPIKEEYIDGTIIVNGEEISARSPVIHGTLDMMTGEGKAVLPQIPDNKPLPLGWYDSLNGVFYPYEEGKK